MCSPQFWLCFEARQWLIKVLLGQASAASKAIIAAASPAALTDAQSRKRAAQTELCSVLATQITCLLKTEGVPRYHIVCLELMDFYYRAISDLNALATNAAAAPATKPVVEPVLASLCQDFAHLLPLTQLASP
jgi:hypothetical protein